MWISSWWYYNLSYYENKWDNANPSLIDSYLTFAASLHGTEENREYPSSEVDMETIERGEEIGHDRRNIKSPRSLYKAAAKDATRHTRRSVRSVHTYSRPPSDDRCIRGTRYRRRDQLIISNAHSPGSVGPRIEIGSPRFWAALPSRAGGSPDAETNWNP